MVDIKSKDMGPEGRLSTLVRGALKEPISEALLAARRIPLRLLQRNTDVSPTEKILHFLLSQIDMTKSCIRPGI